VAKLVAEHQAEGADLQLLGLAAPDISHLLELELGAAPAERGPPSEDVPPAPAKPKTKLGDLYELGPHRLLCGDSTDLATVEGLMEGELAHLVFTDPPYGVGYEGGTVKRKKLSGDHRGTGIYSEVLPVIAAVSAEKAPLYLWHASSQVLTVGRAVEEAGWQMRSEIIWSKNNAQFGALGAQYKQKHEPLMYAHRRGRAPWWYGPSNEVTVWEAAAARYNKFHPTQKPVELAERALRNSSQEGELVLDAFAGSGSTLIACETTGRIGRALELDRGYCDVIVARWEEYTGQKAERHRRRR
jgi:DNA modification methylase